MSARFPIRRYAPWLALTSLGSIGRIAVYVAEQAASQMPIWADLPWGTVALFAIGALIGAIYADAVNAESQLRTWWREKRFFVIFHPIYERRIMYDQGENHGGRMWHAGMMLRLEFKRKTRLDAIRMTGYVYRFNDRMPINDGPWAMHVWKSEDGQEYLKGDTIDVPLAHIPYQKEHPGFYGDLGNHGRYLSAGSAHLIIIELLTENAIQTRKVLILLPTRGISATTTGGRFVALQEDDIVFPRPPSDTSNLFTVEKNQPLYSD